MNYWTNKEKNAELAIKHYNEMEERYPYDIDFSAKHSYVIKNVNIEQPAFVSDIKTTVHFPLKTTTDCLLSIYPSNLDRSIYKDIALLNFASYKNPGGKFLEGSMAQEESLCHVSALANILNRHMEDFYLPHRVSGAANKGLYYDEALFSPDVPFMWGEDGTFQKKYCNVITCAAPNRKAFLRYNTSEQDKKKADQAFFDRIRFVLHIARSLKINRLILGAFGCGVFGNDPRDCASIFRRLLMTEFAGTFEYIYISQYLICQHLGHLLMYFSLNKVKI